MGKSSSKTSKKSSKSSKHDQISAEPELWDILNFGLLRFPALQSELPNLFTALDTKKGVMTSTIDDDDMRVFLDHMMHFLPVTYLPHEGWVKHPNTVESVSKMIIDILLTSGSIIQPANMTSSQSNSTRFSASKFLILFEKFPELLSEIEPILQTIHDGGAVGIDQIENEDVVELISSFLNSIGLEVIDDEHGYALPASKSTRLNASYALSQYLGVLKSYMRVKSYFDSKRSSSASRQQQPQAFIATHHPSQNHEDDHDDSSSSSSSDSSDDDYGDEVRRPIADAGDHTEEDVISHRIGPAIPSFAQLQYAQAQAQRFSSILANDHVDDHDDIGPSLPTAASASGPSTQRIGQLLNNLPLGYVDLSSSLTTQHSGSNDTSDDTIQHEHITVMKPATMVREDWMLTPGERDPFSGIKDDTNRKFQTGKTAKKLAEALIKQREEYEQQAKDNNFNSADVIEEHNLKRGPSLMEQHHQAKRSKQVHVESSSNERMPFDRERDVLSHKKMNNLQVEKLVEHARELDSRFSKGFVQKSSL